MLNVSKRLFLLLTQKKSKNSIPTQVIHCIAQRKSENGNNLQTTPKTSSSKYFAISFILVKFQCKANAQNIQLYIKQKSQIRSEKQYLSFPRFSVLPVFHFSENDINIRKHNNTNEKAQHTTYIRLYNSSHNKQVFLTLKVQRKTIYLKNL